MSDTFSELESFDGSFKPSEGIKPGPEALPDDEYDFQILHSELTRTKKANELILRQTLRVLDAATAKGKVAAGKEIERVYFFGSQIQVDILGGDLCRLGVDADKWSAESGRPFSKELPNVLPKLVGLKFHARKVTNVNTKDPSKTYNNIYIGSVLSGTSLPTVASGPPGVSEDEIPF